MNYRECLKYGELILKKNSISTADIDAEMLLSFSLNKSREKILLNLDYKIKEKEINLFNECISRRKQKEPVSLITGERYFWNLYFKINKNVLTPRFETELLIEELLRQHNLSHKINILDVGLGSGCILISLLKERSKWLGTGIDISKNAIKNAKFNAKIQQVDNRIKFVNSDIDKFCSGKYDLVVTNPPYIDLVGYNNLDKSVKDFEPKKALYGGIDGLRVIEKVIKRSKIILKNNGTLAMEIGLGQYYKTLNILKKNGFVVFKTLKDYQKIKRCIITKKIN